MKLVSAKCPNCGADLKLSKEAEKIECEYCNKTIIVEDAIACYKLKVTGKIDIEGIESNSELITAATELMDMNEYLKAKRKFLEFTQKCPDNYQGWLGLLICRTRVFSIKDQNSMFENDINNYYKNFLRTAPAEIKNQYIDIIENYFCPSKANEMSTINEPESKSNFSKLKKVKFSDFSNGFFNSKAPKNKWIALFYCILFGFFGVHKFYEGKIIIGLLYIFTFGLFGIGVLVDIFSILFKPVFYYIQS